MFVIRHPIAFALCLLLAPYEAPAQHTSRDLRRQTLETVWRTVKDRHFDPSLVGVDWDAVRDRYRPRVLAAARDEEYYRLLNEMLGELGQSHFVVFPPWLFADAGRTERGDVGIEVRLVEGRVTIVRVVPESSAHAAGLRTGFVVTHVGGEPVAALLRRIERGDVPSPKRRTVLVRTVRSRLRGASGSTVHVRLLDERDRPRSVVLERHPASGEVVALGEMPPLRARVESSRVDRDFGYLRFDLFALPVLPPVREAMRSFHDAKGVVVDLRGNAGGEIAVSTAIAGLFYSKRCSLGTTRFRDGTLERPVYPSRAAFEGPLVILVDEGTASAAETFTAALQESGRATVVGQTTAGSALPSVFERLPCGGRLQYAIGEYRTPMGVVLEGRGVAPEVAVEPTRRDLLAGRDAALDVAVSLLRKLSPRR